MSKLTSNFAWPSSITWPPSRKMVYAIGGVGGAIAILSFWKQWNRADKQVNGRSSRRLSVFPDESEAVTGLESTVLFLEKLLSDLEKKKLNSETDRNRYDLIQSILLRLNGARSDFEKFRKNDFGLSTTATEDIARSLWSSALTPKAGTLSVLSDDTFFSAVDDLSPTNLADFDTNSISIDFADLALYKEALKRVENGTVKVRKIRSEFCGCDSDEDFLAKVYCLRLAFNKIISNEKTRQWLIQEGRVIFADLMRHDLKNPTEYFAAYDRLMQYLNDLSNYETTKRELELRKVEEINLWDVLFDFVLLDSFDDLRKPPSSIVALFRNNFFSRSFKESTLNSLIWSMIKVKRSKLVEKDGFISHFYDISQIVSPMLIFAYFGDGPKSFQDLCLYFKEAVYAFVLDIFNPQKVRFTTVDELAEDVQRLLEIRLENLQVKISNELIPV
uniref:Uncharacterized protein n=1 Tax=Panagrolaimus sp. JU765 TaxID=591449 RepID=A0AC34QU73_9BILA